MNSEFDELNENEREQFARLARQKTPPKILEDRTVEALKNENLIRLPQTRRNWNWLKLNPIFASVLGIFIIGVAVAATWYFGFYSAGKRLPQFILLLRESPEQSERRLSNEEFVQLSEDYNLWTDEMRQKEILLEGDNLEGGIRILDKVNGQIIVSRPDSKEGLITGWFIIRAENFEQAIKIAESCPHLKFGGRIEVRQIEKPELN
jgi:hypothetical protein